MRHRPQTRPKFDYLFLFIIPAHHKASSFARGDPRSYIRPIDIVTNRTFHSSIDPSVSSSAYRQVARAGSCRRRRRLVMALWLQLMMMMMMMMSGSWRGGGGGVMAREDRESTADAGGSGGEVMEKKELLSLEMLYGGDIDGGQNWNSKKLMMMRPEVKGYMEWLERLLVQEEEEEDDQEEEEEAKKMKKKQKAAPMMVERSGGGGGGRAAAAGRMAEPPPPPPPPPRVIVVNKVAGLSHFHSIQRAIDSIPKPNYQRIIIHLSAGTYHEKVKIPKGKPFVTLLGMGANKTKITWHDTANASGTTFKSATVSVMSDGFVARGITFENSSPAPKPGAMGAQAVAFQISGDKASIYDCAFYGAQDTLYDHKGRHYFKNCLIQGSIDFIFGNGQSIYQGCELQTIETTGGSLTAQKRKVMGEMTGFIFINCTVGGQGSVLLARAWGAYSRVVFIYSYLADIILPGGYSDWGIPSRQKTSFYGEYKCFGPGANRHTRVAWSYELNDAQVGPFLSLNFIDGNSWLTSLE